jgi:hypothetical protein
MTDVDLLPPALLKRKAVVYVRQSTQAQVHLNLESQRRQYELVDEARRRGFRDVEVIDDDLGRSASGTVARPGFDKLVAWLCAGEVGAVLCFDASRLARNGRDNRCIGLSHDARVTLRPDHRMSGGKIRWQRFQIPMALGNRIIFVSNVKAKLSPHRGRAPCLLRIAPIDSREQITELGRGDRHRAVSCARPQEAAPF